MLDERPTAAELVTAVADFLDREVLVALDGRLVFHTKVSVNALRIVARELVSGAESDDAELARLRGLTGADGDVHALNMLLAERIRSGEIAESDSGLREHLVRSVLARIAIDSPGYPSVGEAAIRWTDGG